MANSTRELYNSNADFKRYVDAYCKNYNEGRSISLEEALQHKIVQAYAVHLETKYPLGINPYQE